MNRPVAIAGLLSIATFFLHVIGGGAEVHTPFLESELTLKLKAFASVLWHFVSAMLLINGGFLLIAARAAHLRKPLVLLVSAQYLATVGIFLFYGITRLGTLWIMPQWVIFLVISAVMLWGLRSPQSRAAR